jgi:hypothetical protein
MVMNKITYILTLVILLPLSSFADLKGGDYVSMHDAEYTYKYSSTEKGTDDLIQPSTLNIYDCNNDNTECLYHVKTKVSSSLAKYSIIDGGVYVKYIKRNGSANIDSKIKLLFPSVIELNKNIHTEAKDSLSTFTNDMKFTNILTSVSALDHQYKDCIVSKGHSLTQSVNGYIEDTYFTDTYCKGVGVVKSHTHMKVTYADSSQDSVSNYYVLLSSIYYPNNSVYLNLNFLNNR